MPKITSVEPQKKNPHRFNVYLEGAFAFGADEDLIVEHHLVIGKVLNPQDVEKLLFEAEVGKLLERMYRLWNIRPRSEREVRDYFRIKNYELRIKGKEQFSNLAIEQLVNKLKEKGMLNDLEFAKVWVESRRKKKGPRVLKQELFQKGIDREIIDEVISGQGTGYSGHEIAETLMEKKMKVLKNLSPSEFKKKAYEFLLRRGFEYEVVKEVIEKFLQKR